MVAEPVVIIFAVDVVVADVVVVALVVAVVVVVVVAVAFVVVVAVVAVAVVVVVVVVAIVVVAVVIVIAIVVVIVRRTISHIGKTRLNWYAGNVSYISIGIWKDVIHQMVNSFLLSVGLCVVVWNTAVLTSVFTRMISI